MLSWIFRHCARLSVVYGAAEAPELAGARFEQQPAPSPRRRPLRPGELRLARGRCELRPMPKRVSPVE